MDAAFDGPEDEHEGETHGLLAQSGREPTGRIPGDYDFERDYVSFFPAEMAGSC
jgi:hypothetical protein